jgi:hypothetical protein
MDERQWEAAGPVMLLVFIIDRSVTSLLQFTCLYFYQVLLGRVQTW